MFNDSNPSDKIPVPEDAVPVESPSGKIIGWTRTRIVRNGSPRHYDVVWSPLVKMIAGAILGIGVTGIVSTVALYREVGVLSAHLAETQEQLRRASIAIEAHALTPYHLGVYQHFLPREEYHRDQLSRRR
jgi:hypothetical protein